jgi:hypothetical protein
MMENMFNQDGKVAINDNPYGAGTFTVTFYVSIYLLHFSMMLIILTHCLMMARYRKVTYPLQERMSLNGVKKYISLELKMK